MFKKLDKLIIKSFIGPFMAVFFITLLVLVMQFFWLYIDDFVGKGLSAGIIFKFIWYQSAVLVPLALPLAVLLSSLMTFGNLGETFELVAIKSAGISLLRFMRPLFLLSLVISILAFLFSNYVIPVANLKSHTILSDIVRAKPAFDLREGVFYDKIPNFAIKIGKKEENDSVIRDVIIFENDNSLQDNFIVAKSGVMRTTPDKRYLEFLLRDGWRYQERADRYGSNQTEYVRLGFKEYKKNLDLSTFQIAWTSDSSGNSNQRMLSIRQLNRSIDSLGKEYKRIEQQLQNDVYLYLPFMQTRDSMAIWQRRRDSLGKKDTAVYASFNQYLPDSAAKPVYDRAISQVNSLRSGLEATGINLKERAKEWRKHKIEWHRKIVLSLACLVLFMIGAPLGAIIRKGGLGSPLIFSIVFFMVFYFTTTTGEKFAKEGALSPFAGMWLATFVLTPIGLFLTYKAMRDSQLFNKEFYSRLIRKIRRKV
ncbi:LptF/LptG family permease [Nostoc ellipsosporum NOK]|nr:LptF/LptG family permease [Nostoc ellipsosporum NOK]